MGGPFKVLCILEGADVSLSKGSASLLIFRDREEPRPICSMPSDGVIGSDKVA